MARPAFKTAQESFPRSGNRELPIVISFAGGNTVSDDLTPEMQQSQIESVQAVWIDNSLNPSAFKLTLLDPIAQIIVAAPFSQGLYPIMSIWSLKYTATCKSYSGNVNIVFSNSQKPYFITPSDPRHVLNRSPLNINPLIAGDNIIMAAVAGKYNYVFRMLFDVSGATNIQFFNGASANNLPLTGLITLFGGGSLLYPYDEIPWLLTSAGNSLVLNSSQAVTLGGQMMSITA
jgi:hypothetical protein